MTALRLSSHAANSHMSPHLHRDCSFTVVVRGGYQETIRREDTEHLPRERVVLPGSSGSSKLIFVPTAPSLEVYSGRGVMFSQAPYVRSPAMAQL